MKKSNPLVLQNEIKSIENTKNALTKEKVRAMKKEAARKKSWFWKLLAKAGIGKKRRYIFEFRLEIPINEDYTAFTATNFRKWEREDTNLERALDAFKKEVMRTTVITIKDVKEREVRTDSKKRDRFADAKED